MSVCIVTLEEILDTSRLLCKSEDKNSFRSSQLADDKDNE